MFNVAPIIPTRKSDDQFSERKGLVSNSFVCIVFQEPKTQFHPEMISGRVTQIYITVQPEKRLNENFYKVRRKFSSEKSEIVSFFLRGRTLAANQRFVFNRSVSRIYSGRSKFPRLFSDVDFELFKRGHRISAAPNENRRNSKNSSNHRIEKFNFSIVAFADSRFD